jgi:acyl-CoA synthetase (NDP forming)
MAATAKAVSMGASLPVNGVFMSTHTAGPAVVISDICERGGVRFPELEPDISRAIGEFIPTHALPRNPLDVFAFAWTDPSLYLRSTDLALSQADIGCAVAVFVSGAGSGPAFPAREYAEIGRKHGKPVFICLIAPASYLDEMQEAQREGVIVLNTPEKMGEMLVNLKRFASLRAYPDRKRG